MSGAIPFLKKNGFKRMERNSYANDRCNVVIHSEYYAVSDNKGNAMYSANLNIYWLIGVLTYYGHINKDYEQ